MDKMPNYSASYTWFIWQSVPKFVFILYEEINQNTLILEIFKITQIVKLIRDSKNRGLSNQSVSAKTEKTNKPKFDSFYFVIII